LLTFAIIYSYAAACSLSACLQARLSIYKSYTQFKHKKWSHK